MIVKPLKALIAGVLTLVLAATVLAAPDGVTSIETGFTISKVRMATNSDGSYVVASSYEGTVLGVGLDGANLWINPLSGFTNHDLWCDDLNGDGADEILAANADGTLYCLSHEGELLWKFNPSSAPMNAVCVVHEKDKPYVVCGGYDNHIYYLSADGKLINTIASKSYSIEKPWGKDKSELPPKNLHTANFLRPLRNSDGSESLIVHGAQNSISAKGSIYAFDPLGEEPQTVLEVEEGAVVGELRVGDIDGDGANEILLGTSGTLGDAIMVRITGDGVETPFRINDLRKKIDSFGYRVIQPEVINDGNESVYFVLFGSRILLVPPSLSAEDTEVLTCKYSFNDMWKNDAGDKIVLASCQSGGSCVHVLDLSSQRWKRDYEILSPPGKIAQIIKGTELTRQRLKDFVRPEWEREPLPVYLMTESTDSVADVVDEITSSHKSPLFLGSTFMPSVENWDRSSMANEKYRDKRDRRKKYTLTSQQVLVSLVPMYQNAPGIAYWGGHGNDPYMISLATEKKIITSAEGKKTVMIFPETVAHDEDFAWVMEDFFYPLAEYCQGKNGNIFIRTKHIFWQAHAYMPLWSRLMSGEFADVFVPAMEETTDKSMELSIAARAGIWASGATNQWGARCARDNTSYNRLRQHSHQMLPNHFLRQMVYNISSGAQYINNFPVDQEYMSLLWELIAKGALYVPKRDEIVSFSPVHIGMLPPDERYLQEGVNVKWTTFFDAEAEANNPMVFGRLNGTWPGAPVTEWDFSRYAAGVSERRLNYLPPYNNGLVLITPPQHGVFADQDAPRGSLSDHLHPIYQNNLTEYLTDGRDYYSADGEEKYPANEYYETIEAEIKQQAKRLPLTVSGDVAWVVAQTSPTHLRLTVVDSGYINPNTRTATISFHSVDPLSMVDLIHKNQFDLSDPAAVTVEVPCGMFRFIDIELKEPLGDGK